MELDAAIVDSANGRRDLFVECRLTRHIGPLGTAAAEQPDGPADEEVISAQAGHRIARQQEDECLPQTAHAGRTGGPHSDAVDRQFSLIGDNRRRIVFSTDAGTAGDDDDIGARCGQSVSDDGTAVFREGDRFRVAAVSVHQTTQHVRVGLKDLIRRAWCSGRCQLVARDDNPNARPANDVDSADAHRGQQAHVLRTQLPAGGQNACAGLHVFSGEADVFLRWHGRHDVDVIALKARVLGGHDGIGSGRHRSAGHDADCRAVTDFAIKGVSRHRFAQQAKGQRIIVTGPDGLGAAQGVPVHGRAVEGGDVDLRRHL